MSYFEDFEKLEDKCTDEIKKVSKKIKELINIGDEKSIKQAKVLCQKYNNNPKIQSQLIKILLKEKDYEEAKKICENFIDDDVVLSQYLFILIKQENYEEAIQICNQNKENPSVQTHYINILIKKGKFDEAKKICKNFDDNSRIQAKYIKLLIREKKYDEVKLICQRFKDDPRIQSRYVKLLIDNKDYEEAQNICERFKEDKMLQSQLKIIKKKCGYMEIELLDEEKRREKYLNVIKAKLYFNDITQEDINKINENKIGIEEFEKNIILIAVYYKSHNNKMVRQALKNAKECINNDNVKNKQLNLVKDAVYTKNIDVFNWKVFDDILCWHFDNEMSEQIEEKRMQEKEEEKKRQTEINQRIDNEIKKLKEKNTIHYKKPIENKNDGNKANNEKAVLIRKKINFKEQSKSNKPERDKKAKSKTIKDEYLVELLKLKSKILVKVNKMKFGNSKFKVKIKRERIPSEVIEEQKEKFDDFHSSIEDLDKIELLEEKNISNFRAKAQLIILLRKYGMREIANSKLKLESEIVDEINLMNYLQKTVKNFDNSEMLESISKRIEKLDNGKDTAKELLDRVISKDER